MKQDITPPDKGIAPGASDKSSDHATSHSSEAIDALNIYWFAYPFVLVMDLAFVFDALSKMVQNRLFSKRTRTTNHKKKNHETL